MKKEKRPCFKTNKVFIYLYYIFLSEQSEDKDLCLFEAKRYLRKYSTTLRQIIISHIL